MARTHSMRGPRHMLPQRPIRGLRVRPRALLVGTVAFASLLVTAPRATAQPADGSDWPRFLGPTGDGKSSESEILTRWPKGGPPQLWQVEIGEGYSAPSVADGRLFLFDRTGDSARLRSFDVATGDELWRTTYETHYEDYYNYSVGPRASPVIDADRVYTFGVEGRLRCQDVEAGRVIWDLDTAERFGVVKNFFGVGATPVVEGELLIVPVGGSPPDSPKIHSGKVQGNGSGLVALDKLTGEVRYTVTDELASYASPVTATIDGRRWGFSFSRGGLIGFEPGSGEMDFHFPWKSRKLESVNAATPIVVDDTVFITESYGMGAALLRVRPGGSEVVWQDGRRNQAMRAHWATPIHHEGHLYGSSGPGTGDAELRCIEHGSGKLMWSEPGLGRSTLLYVEGHLVVLTEHGRLLVIEASPEAFKVVSDFEPEGRDGKPALEFPAWNAPVLSHGVLYVRGKHRLVAFDLRLRDQPPAPLESPTRRSYP